MDEAFIQVRLYRTTVDRMRSFSQSLSPRARADYTAEKKNGDRLSADNVVNILLDRAEGQRARGRKAKQKSA